MATESFLDARNAHTEQIVDPDRELPDLDRLPGLASRKALLDAVRRSISRGGRLALLVLDVDRFRTINESFGHNAGDRVLEVVAERLRSWAGPHVSVGRSGDDEFALFLASEFDGQLVIASGEHLVALLGESMLVGDEEIRVTVSVGIAMGGGSTAGGERLFREAGLALAHAKHLGGNRCESLDEEGHRSATARARLETDLRKALDSHQIGVHFQPIVRFDGTIVSVEALARWTHPRLGPIPPSEFVPLAEEAGLITQLGTQVTEMAAESVAQWRRDLAPSLKLSVNTSACQLAEDGAANAIRDALASSGLDPSAVCLELTETAFLEDQDHAAAALADLHDQGMEIAVDDFGTGYSSLMYLDRFPVQILKVDRHFISGLGTGQAANGIVNSIVELAHSLGLVAVAEGVETIEQVRGLTDLGCDLGQGYYWSRPLPASDMESLLTRGTHLG